MGQNDLGRDYEHCLLLQKKADNQESSVSIVMMAYNNLTEIASVAMWI